MSRTNNRIPKRYFFRGVRKLVSYFYKCNTNDLYLSQLYQEYVSLFDQSANDYIRMLLHKGEPCMISKFGGFELTALCEWKASNKREYGFRDYWNYFKGISPTIWWLDSIDGLCSNAGFFPNEILFMPEYYDVNVAAMKEIDVLGSYLGMEFMFDKELKDAVRVNLNGYYAPFLYTNPWTKELRGKRVLVVHPFAEDIEMQYRKRGLLWDDKDILPDFELITYKSIQSMLGAETGYKTWFEALAKMEKDISDIDFDIALIGCGAYGMPLAAYVKKMGKQSIHLAGWTQLLFGIKGKRWDDYEFVYRYYNENWINPSNSSRPREFRQIENGCYW